MDDCRDMDRFRPLIGVCISNLIYQLRIRENAAGSGPLAEFGVLILAWGTRVGSVSLVSVPLSEFVFLIRNRPKRHIL